MTVQEPTTTADMAADDADKTRYAVKKHSAKLNTVKPDTVVAEGMLIKQRYLLEGKIGSGGMSDIYRATDTFLQKAGVQECTVAIKVLQNQFVNQPEALQLLFQEAHKTQQLSHPNIVRVFDVDTDELHHFIVMEFLDGESLDQVIKRYKPKGLPLKSAYNLLLQIADALNYAHKVGIVHADLKPANIMVNRAGVVKVLDFGVSQTLQLNHDIYAAEQQSQTAPLNGYTPAYASPQLLAGNSPCVADDLYSFACVSYELLSSKHPFDRLPADKAAEQNKKAQKPKHLNAFQWRPLKRALQFDVKSRNTTISDIMHRFTLQLWQPTVAAAAVVALVFAGWHYHQQQQNSLAQLEQKTAAAQAMQQQYQRILDATPTEILATVSESTQLEVPYQAALRLQQSSIVSHFEQQIDQLLSDKSYTYPNYPEIERILSQAQTLYPDSHYLAGISNNMQRSKQTAIEVLRTQLAHLLVNQLYQQQTEAADPFNIHAELKRIDTRYQFMPDAAETDAYVSAFNTAVATNDAQALQQLIKVGQLLFASHEPTAELVSHGQELAAAVDAVTIYQQALASGDGADFPYQAAEVFYQHSFAELENELSASIKAAEVDAIYDKLQQYNSLVPADFSLHVALRRKLADKYLNLSGELLQSNQVRTAERLMRRANELMSSLPS